MLSKSLVFFRSQDFKMLLFIFLIAFLLKTLFLPQNALTFGFDQGRDAFVVEEILNGDVKIIGPSVSGIPGFYHGVFYYYFILPAYWIGGGNPITVSYWMALFSSLNVFLIYFIVLNVVKNRTPALVASFLFAVSFEFSQYATWLSNPSMGVWFVTSLYLGLYLWTKKKNALFGALLCGLGFGLSIQSNFSLTYHLVPICIWLFIYRKKINKLGFLLFMLTFFIATSSIILSQFKFGFPAILGIKHIINGFLASNKNLSQPSFMWRYISDMKSIFSNNLFPQNSLIGLIVGGVFLAIGVLKVINKTKNKIYLLSSFWILSYFIPSSLGGFNKPHIGVGIGVGLIVLVSTLVWELSKKHFTIAIVIMSIIVLSNVTKILTENNKGQTIFAIQKGLILRNEINAVDYTYVKSNGGNFSINSLTSPLFINTTWAYLYNWYGKEKYGYLPNWSGRDQIGSLGNNILTKSDILLKHFLIVEDMTGIPTIYLIYVKGDEDERSYLKNEVNFGTIMIQEREAKI